MALFLGFEVGSSADVEIPLKHLAVTGQTQEAGKTTALEALIARSRLRAVTFITKRGEASFGTARRIDPYFREQADWQFVASILEASRSEKLKFERAWIIRASKGARTLADVQRNVQKAMETAKGMSADVYLTLDAYLEAVVPQIATVQWATKLSLAAGVNVVDLTGLNVEMQHLVIKSTITWVLEKEHDTVVVVPEAWKFIPQGRGTPVKLAAESFIRQAAALGNYLWLDSQDIAGVDKMILKSVPVWILGVQREANEIKRTLDNIPAGLAKPKAADIATLELGQFYACWGRHSIKTYVQPAWLPDHIARQVAAGEVPVQQSLTFMPAPAARSGLPPAFLLPALQPPERPPPMHDQAESLTDEMKWATTKLGGNVDEKWDVNTFKSAVENAARKLAAGSAPAAAGNGHVQIGPVEISATERAVSITFSQEMRSFETTGVRGRIMFVLVNELKNTPSREADIIKAMIERGWNHPRQSVSPELAKLVKNGDLVRDDATYRLPGKLILTIDGKAPSANGS